MQLQIETFFYFFFQILTLHFVVLSFDRYSRDDVMGEVLVEMEGLDFSNSDTCPLSLGREITPRYARGSMSCLFVFLGDGQNCKIDPYSSPKMFTIILNVKKG